MIPAVELGTFDRIRAAAPQPRTRRSGRRTTGIIPIVGWIASRPSFWAELVGMTSARGISAVLGEFLEDPDVDRIILDVDSPGGEVAGMTELAGEIRDAWRRVGSRSSRSLDPGVGFAQVSLLWRSRSRSESSPRPMIR